MDDICKEHYKVEFLFADNTEFYADSVEWCPFSNFAEFIACGTYQLEEIKTNSDDAQTRKGSVILYKLSSLEEEQRKLEKVSTFYCSGVLDMKWCPKLIEGYAFLAVACSDGQILVLKLCNENNTAHLSSVSYLNLAETTKNMILSLDWSCESDGSIKLIASDTLGHLNYLQLNENKLLLLNSWKCHDFESWISAFDYSQSHIVYSGGDDCRFKGWDTRNLAMPTFVSKRHSMGVTTISKNKKNDCQLVTGSYDENVFLWDTRSLKSPVSETSLGGGIWRLKWHPYKPDYLLSASMHNGFHVLSETNWNLKVVNHYTNHESLAYGVDWGKLPIHSENTSEEKMSYKKAENFVASCSFYDKLFHVWKINL